KHIANATLSGEARVERISDVFFFKSMDEKRSPGATGRPPADEKIEYLDDPNSPNNPYGIGGFREALLPDSGERKKVEAGADPAKKPEPAKSLGQTITFGVTVELPYPEVPKFIREIIAPSKTASAIIVNLAGARVLLRDQNELTHEVEVVYQKG